MAESIAHRGPDDQGTWWDQEAGIGLAHRRLSIIDLSPHGHQPMPSADGRFILSYNGEIYNHLELRSELEQQRLIAWRGHSDTETLIECISAWGLGKTLQKSVGMFALAVWDRRERVLHLGRDRFGEKPLYYGWVGGDFAFGSELKALRRHPCFDNPIEPRAVRSFAGLAYIPAPLSIYERIYKLEPGCILTVSEGGWCAPAAPANERGTGPLKLERYWSYRQTVINGIDQPFGGKEEAQEGLEQSLIQAIRGQSVADVPVGAFLSGGIDSSTIVALYRKHASGTVKTFSIGFEEAGFNEAIYAKEVARHLGTDHHERYLSFRDAQAAIPRLPTMYDEPFADASQIPTHLVSAFAREQVKVVLSGDGGDELFGGYNRYFATERLWAQLNRLPRPFRTAVGGIMAQLPPTAWNTLTTMLPSKGKTSFIGSTVHKRFRTMRDAWSFEDVAASFLDEWAGNGSPVLPKATQSSSHIFDMDLAPNAPNAARMMFSDAVSYLPDDVLCKVDRAAMSVSLETRIPFLDHRVAEVAARIPVSMKMGNNVGKLILRDLLYKHAPRKLFERPKAGFAVPVGEWIKGPLRPWAEEMLHSRELRQDGFFDPEIIQRRWHSHLAGQENSTQALWSVLMFQSWLDENRREPAPLEPRQAITVTGRPFPDTSYQPGPTQPVQFSVVIPLFNKKPFIRRTLESVLAQDHSSFEVIVVDDGSTDGSPEELQDLLGPKVRLVRQQNSGPGAARNHGVAEARFPWIALLDADDRWMKNHLSTLASLIEKFPHADVVATAFKRSHTQQEDGALENSPHLVGGYKLNYFREMAIKEPVCSSTAAIRRETFLKSSGFRLFWPGEDTELWARLALEHEFAASPTITTYYTVNTGGIIDSLSNSGLSELEMWEQGVLGTLDKALSDQRYSELHADLSYCRDMLLSRMAKQHLYIGHPRSARAYLGRIKKTRTVSTALWRMLSYLPAPVVRGAVHAYSDIKRVTSKPQSR